MLDECIVCGCTDDDACFDAALGMPCHWVAPGLLLGVPLPADRRARAGAVGEATLVYRIGARGRRVKPGAGRHVAGRPGPLRARPGPPPGPPGRAPGEKGPEKC